MKLYPPALQDLLLTDSPIGALESPLSRATRTKNL